MFRIAALAVLLVTITIAINPIATPVGAVPQTFIVNTTADTFDSVCDANCSIRDAIFQANSTGDRDTIQFAIAGTGVKTFNMAQGIVITSNVIIDGTTQSGASCTTHNLTIEFDGTNAGAGVDGITINHSVGTGTLIKGIAIRDWGGNGVTIALGALHGVRCSNIGTNAAGTAAAPNAGDGIRIAAATFGAGGITIGAVANAGDPDDQERNIISGNTGAGVRTFFGSSGSGDGGGNLRISGNYIGLNAAGTAAIPNGDSGVVVAAGPSSIGRDVAGGGGGVGVGNVISGNTGTGDAGVKLLAAADNPKVHGNIIGLNAAGTAAVPNQVGVYIESDLTFIGTDDPTWRNVISGNIDDGILGTSTAEFSIKHSYIGTNLAGSAAIPNARGVTTAGVGGSIGANSHGNVISGNTGAGITFVGASNIQVIDNQIGYAADETTPLPNGGDGISILSSPLTASSSLTIGSDLEGDPNHIYARRPNAGTRLRNGIRVEKTAGHQPISGGWISGNLIDSDGNGIDLRNATDVDNLVTPNDLDDVDSGPNSFQNFPIITEAFASPSPTVRGTLNSLPNFGFNIEIFKSTSCDSNTRRQAHTYLGRAQAFTNDDGDYSWQSFENIGTFLAGDFITVTARSFQTDPPSEDGINTSELSACFVATGAPVHTISQLTPTSVVAGASQFNLRVQGTNFNNSMKIRWNGQELTTAFFSATDVRADIDTNVLGYAKSTATITVGTTGNLTLGVPFTVLRSSSDVNCDGTANPADALLLMQVLAGLATNNTACPSDAKQNGGVGLDDVTYIRREAAGLQEPQQSAHQ